MAFHRFADPTYWDAITPAHMRWSQEAARGAGFELGAVPLGPVDDNSAPQVSILSIPPGGVLPRHAHDCYRVEVVLFGSIDTGNDTPLGPGDTMISVPGEWYGPHTAGPQGAVTVEVFSNGTAEITFAEVDDPVMAAAIANAQRKFAEARSARTVT